MRITGVIESGNSPQIKLRCDVNINIQGRGPRSRYLPHRDLKNPFGGFEVAEILVTSEIVTISCDDRPQSGRLQLSARSCSGGEALGQRAITVQDDRDCCRRQSVDESRYGDDRLEVLKARRQ